MEKKEVDVDEVYGKSHGVEGGESEMNVEGQGDGERGDVTHPRGPRFVREEREGIRRKNERKSLTGGEGVEVGM